MIKLKNEIKELDKQKKELEETMLELADGLNKKGSLIGSLVDEDGFPRNDIDVHNTIIQRKTLNCNHYNKN
jgi:hypothetical protein